MPAIANVTDYREAARRRLPRLLFDYLDGGAYDEVTLRRNVEDLQKVTLRQRVLTDVSCLSLETELFGRKLPMPVALAPIGMSGMFARRGEVQAARAAHRHGAPFCLSTVSICSVEEVVRESGAPVWFQLYMIKDRGFVAEMLARVKAAGCPVLVFTVDLPIAGARYRDVRSGMSGQPGLATTMSRVAQGLSRPAWLWDVQVNGKPHSFGNLAPAVGEKTALGEFAKWIGANFDASVTWNDIAWVRERWDGPLVIKGVLDPEDARAARNAGADGIVVSNHGGRQLDGVLSGAAALPAVRDKIGDDLTVLSDGGIRSGLDVLRSLALGADGVLLGRAWAWALGARGMAGVDHVLSLIRAELSAAMALTGCTDLRKIGRELLA